MDLMLQHIQIINALIIDVNVQMQIKHRNRNHAFLPFVIMLYQSFFTGLMGFLHISGVCTTANLSTQQDGARLTASTFSHLQTRVST